MNIMKKLIAIALATVLLSGCSVFTGSRTEVKIDGLGSYSSPKEQDIELRYNPQTGEVFVKSISKQNADMAAQAGQTMGEANKALAEAAKALIDKVP